MYLYVHPTARLHCCVHSFSQYFKVSSFERVHIFTLLQGFILACIHILSDCNVSSRISCLNPIAKSSRYVHSYCQPHFKVSLLSVYIVLLHCRSRIFGSTHIITPSQGLFVQTVHIFTPFKGLILFPTEVTMQTYGRYYSH